MDSKRYNRGEGGFTLLEVVVALGILSVGMIALASLATSNIKSTESARRVTQAVNIATEKIEALKAVSPSSVMLTGDTGGIERTCSKTSDSPPTYECTPTNNQVVLNDSVPYDWKWVVTYVDLDGDGVYTDTDGQGTEVIDNNDVRRVDVTVEWRDLFGDHSVTMTALRSNIF